MGVPYRGLTVALALAGSSPVLAATATTPSPSVPAQALVDQAHQLRMQGAELANQRYEEALAQMQNDVSTALQEGAAAKMSLKATQSYWKRWCGPVPGCATPRR